MNSVFANIPGNIQEELLQEIDVAEKDLLDWKKHIMRTLLQDMAKSDVLKKMGINQGLLIMDWAMKYFPFQFRETQSDFFGKRGMSWHVTCLVTKSCNEDGEVDLQSSGHLVPSPILGLANAPIVETKFLELAMSLLDSSPRIPLGTFSILLLTSIS